MAWPREHCAGGGGSTHPRAVRRSPHIVPMLTRVTVITVETEVGQTRHHGAPQRNTIGPTSSGTRAREGAPHQDLAHGAVAALEDVAHIRHSVPTINRQTRAQLNEQPQHKRPPATGPRNRQEQLYWDFWLKFRERVAAEHPDWKARPGTSRVKENATLPGTTPGTRFCSAFRPGPLRLELIFVHGNPAVNLSRFNALRAKRGRFEEALGETAAWDDMPERNDTRVYVVSPFERVDDRDAWPAMMDWLIEKHVRFRHAIQAVGGLDAS